MSNPADWGAIELKEEGDDPASWGAKEIDAGTVMGVETAPPDDAPFAPTPEVKQPTTVRGVVEQALPIVRAIRERERTPRGLFNVVNTPLGIDPERIPTDIIQHAALKGLSNYAPKTAETALRLKQSVDKLMDTGMSPIGVAGGFSGRLPVAAQRAISATFGVDMAATALPEAAKELGRASVEGSTPEVVQKAFDFGAATTMAAFGLKHSTAKGLKRELPPPERPPRDQRGDWRSPLLPDEGMANRMKSIRAAETVLKAEIAEKLPRAMEALRSLDPVARAEFGIPMPPKRPFREMPPIIGEQPQAFPGELVIPFINENRGQVAREPVGLADLPGRQTPDPVAAETPTVQFPPARPPAAGYVPPPTAPVPPEALRGEFPPPRPPAIGDLPPYVPPPAEGALVEGMVKAGQAPPEPPRPPSIVMQRFANKPIAQAWAEAQGAPDQPPITPRSIPDFMESWGQAQIDAWRKRLGRSSMDPRGVIDPQLLAGMAAKGAAKLVRGITDYSIWSREMLRDHGPDIQPHLQSIYNEAVKLRASMPQPQQPTPTPNAQPTEVPSPSQIPPVQRLASEPPAEGQTQTRTPSVQGDGGGGQPQAQSEVLLGGQLRFPELVNHPVEAFGFERIPILGKWFGERPRAVTPQDNAVLRFADHKGQGQAVASAFAQEIGGTIDRHFQVDDSGRIMNIGLKDSRQSRYISDVFEGLQENPNAYVLTPDQRGAFNRIMEFEREWNRLEEREGIFLDESGNYIGGQKRKKYYFPRVIVSRPDAPAAVGRGRTIIAGRKFFQQERGFPTERQGVEGIKDKDGNIKGGGYRYERSIERRLVSRVERLYQAVAEQRLKNDPSMNLPTRKVMEEQLKIDYAEELSEGRMTEADIKSIAEGVIDTESAIIQKTLDRAFPASSSQFRNGFNIINSRLKAIKFTADLGVGQIQLLPTLYSNPGVWAKSQAMMLQALFSPQGFREYARNNITYIREMAQLGSSVGTLEEFLAGFDTRSKGGVDRAFAPIATVLKPFGRSFQTALDVAKIELYKSYRDITPPAELPKVMQTIESQLQMGRMESIGLNRNRTLLERALFLAPSYYRGALNLPAAMAERGVSGKVARRAMGAYMLGTLATFYGVGTALNELGWSKVSQEDLTKRLDPRNSSFLSWDVTMDDDQVIRFGLGGVYHGLTRLAGNVVKTATEHPGNFATLESNKNPFVRWYRGHAAPAPGLIWDGITGRDFLENDTNVPLIAASQVPLVAGLALQELKPLRPKGEKPPTGFEYAATIFGIRAYPLSDAAEKSIARDEIAQKLHAKPYNALNIRELIEVSRQLEKLPQFLGGEQSPRAREVALELADERLNRLRRAVPQNNQLEDLGLKLRNYEPSLTAGNVQISLPRERHADYERFVVEEYVRALTPRMMETIRRLPPVRRQEILDKRLSQAREIAKKRMFNALR